ncbi:MAG: glycyl-radical enzyme activating protein [Armatimonadota bacterium]|nr:glycyl-radical enzyme activating protein [Armatimonadota bacterium]
MSDEVRAVEGVIFDIDETAVHDGPGVRMNLYLKGCPLRCTWCHSPESHSPRPEVVWYQTRCVYCGACLNACPEAIRAFGPIEPELRTRCRLCGACVAICPAEALEICGETVTAGEIADAARRLMPFFERTGGGVTLTGGEPTAQPNFAYAVATLCAKAGIHVAMETCGLTSWETLQRLAGAVDLFLYDLKHPDPAIHEQHTGASNERIIENLRRLIEEGADVIVRVPLIPGITDEDHTVAELAELAADLGAECISLLPFNPATGGKYPWVGQTDPMPDATRQSPERVARLEAICRERGLSVLPP